MEEYREFIRQEVEQLSFTKVGDDDSLVSSKLLDSISVVDLAVAIEEKTKIKISAVEINPGNFDSINSILKFINWKKNG